MVDENKYLITEKAIEKLTLLFGFDEYPLEDWEYMVADSGRVMEFINALENKKLNNNEEKFTLMAVILGSLDDGMSENIDYSDDVWSKIEKIISSDVKLYEYLVNYWADWENDISDAFYISDFIRNIYRKYYK